MDINGRVKEIPSVDVTTHKEGLMTPKEELKEYIINLSSEQIVKALPRLISELEAQGLPVHRLIHLQNQLTLV